MKHNKTYFKTKCELSQYLYLSLCLGTNLWKIIHEKPQDQSHHINIEVLIILALSYLNFSSICDIQLPSLQLMEQNNASAEGAVLTLQNTLHC